MYLSLYKREKIAADYLHAGILSHDTEKNNDFFLYTHQNTAVLKKTADIFTIKGIRSLSSENDKVYIMSFFEILLLLTSSVSFPAISISDPSCVRVCRNTDL